MGDSFGDDEDSDDDNDSKKRKSKQPMTEEQIECLNALQAIQVPEHPAYVSYILTGKDERVYEEMVSRCMKDPENTLSLHDNAQRRAGAYNRGVQRKSRGSDESDTMDFMFVQDDGDENLEVEPSRSASIPRPPV